MPQTMPKYRINKTTHHLNPRVVARTRSAWTHPLADRLSHPGPPAGGHANKYVARYPPRFRSVPLVGSPAHCGFRDASHRFHGAQALCDRPHARRSPLPQQMRLVLQGSYDCCTFVWRSALFVQSRLVLHSHSTPSTRSSTSAGFLPRDSRISPRGWHLCAQEWLTYLCRQCEREDPPLAYECGVCGRLNVRWYSNSWNREALRRTDATTGAARPCPAVGIGLGTHCPVNTCIAAYARLGLALYRIAVYPRSLHSIF